VRHDTRIEKNQRQKAFGISQFKSGLDSETGHERDSLGVSRIGRLCAGARIGRVEAGLLGRDSRREIRGRMECGGAR
jgi:hypothetical protein